ncbi:MAG TPA: calcium-binding protein [Rudaea sp.]|jgi:erythromycin esterase-like protein|nr:calcium-binding protein [Rudaea sp.]
MIRNLLLICGLVVSQFSFGAGGQQEVTEAAQLIRKEAADHRLILIGELHGTREIPKLLAQLMSAYSTEDPVLLGLEVPHSEQPAFVRFLASDGSASATSALLSGPFWQVHNSQHDGRRSYDMVDLIKHVRRLRAEGRQVDILTYDNEPTKTANSEARDKAMADRIREGFAALPRGRFLVLAGNVHAMLERPSNAPAEMQTPMGTYLRDLDPFSVDISARNGEFWACTKQCGAVAAHPSSEASQRTDDGPYNLLVVLPRLSVAHLIGASPH